MSEGPEMRTKALTKGEKLEMAALCYYFGRDRDMWLRLFSWAGMPA